MATEAPNNGAVEPRPWQALVDLPGADTPDVPVTDTPEPTETPEPDTQGTAPVEETPVPEVPVDDEETHRGYLRHSDYTKKAQELAEAKRALARERVQLQAETADAKELIRLMRANPEWAQDIYASAQARGVDAQVQQNAAIPAELQEAIERSKSAASQMELMVLSATISTERDRLAREMKFSPDEAKALVLDAFEDEILEVGMKPDKVGRRLEKVFKAASADRARAQGQRELKTKLQEGAKAASLGARPAAPRTPERTGPVGWDKATEAAIEAVRKTRSG